MPNENVAVSALLGLILIATAGLLIVGSGAVCMVLAARGRRLLPAWQIRRVPWEGTHIAGLVLLYVVLAAGVGSAVLSTNGGKLTAIGAVAVGLGLNVAFAAAAWLILRRSTNASAEDLGFRLTGLRDDVVRGIVALGVALPIVMGVSYAANKVWPPSVEHPVARAMRDQAGASTFALALFGSTIVAPIVEEFFFRGVLLGWLDRVALTGLGRRAAGDDLQGEISAPNGFGWRLVLANCAASAVFAAIHANVWPTPVPIFILSLFLGVLFQRTGSLAASITLHGLFNAFNTIFFFLAIQSGRPTPPASHPPAAIVTSLEFDRTR